MIEISAKDLLIAFGPLVTWLVLTTWKNKRDLNIVFKAVRDIKKNLNLPEGFTYDRDKDSEA